MFRSFSGFSAPACQNEMRIDLRLACDPSSPSCFRHEVSNLDNDRSLSQLDLRVNPLGRGTRRCWRGTMAPNIRCEAKAVWLAAGWGEWGWGFWQPRSMESWDWLELLLQCYPLVSCRSFGSVNGGMSWREWGSLIGILPIPCLCNPPGKTMFVFTMMLVYLSYPPRGHLCSASILADATRGLRAF